jgi:hypothetical protein
MRRRIHVKPYEEEDTLALPHSSTSYEEEDTCQAI